MALLRDAQREGIWYARSRTSRRSYLIQEFRGNAVCDCPGYRRHRKCWHTEEVLDMTSNERTPQQERNEKADAAIGWLAGEELDSTGRSVALVPVRPAAQNHALVPSRDEISSMRALARTIPMMHGMIPSSIKGPAQAFAIVLAGWELGVRPLTALRHIFIVNGRTEPDAQLSMGIVMANDPTVKYRWVERTGERATIQMWRKRNGAQPLEVTYSLEDAKRSGQYQASKADSAWVKYPMDMLAWAVIKRANRLGAADLINAIEGLGGIPVDMADEILDGGDLPAPQITQQADDWDATDEWDAGPAGEAEPITDDQREALQRAGDAMVQDTEAAQQSEWAAFRSEGKD